MSLSSPGSRCAHTPPRVRVARIARIAAGMPLPRRPALALTAVLCLLWTAAGSAAQDTVYTRDVDHALEEIEKQCGHFFELKKIDWKSVSREFRKEAARVKSDGDHLVLLTRLLARLRDGHARVVPLEKGKNVEWPDPVTGKWVGPGMSLCRIGKKIYVKHSWSSAERAGVKVGSQVLAVDGMAVDKWLAAQADKHRDLRSFSTDHHEFFFTCHGGLGAVQGSRLKLEVKEPGGKRSKKTITYSGNAATRAQGAAFPPENLSYVGELSYGTTARGFGYIHLARCRGDLLQDLDQALAAIGDVPGMILDFRGNSGGSFDHDAVLGRFVPKDRTLNFAKRISSAGPNPYGGPLVVIVDGTTVSAGETGSGMFKEDGRGYMIGESPTAGMSSSKTTIELPSRLFGLYVSVASNKGRFNEGRGIEGIGVLPHEIVSYSAKDLAKGVDTLIVAAEKWLTRPKKGQVPYSPEQFGWKKP